MAAGTLQLPTTGTVSGLTMAGDINTALAALATQNEGGSAPTPSGTGLTGTGGVFWHDTSLSLLKLRDQADSVFMPWAQVDETNKLVTPAVAPVYGTPRNLKFTAAGGTATATLTVDEWVGKTAIGGSAFLAASASITVNLGGTGVDGLDTGTVANNTLYRTYGLLNTSTQAIHTLTTKDSNSAPSPIPSGYVLLSVIGYVLTDGSGHILALTQEDRRCSYQSFVPIITGHNAITSLTSQSISAAVPAGAKAVSLLMGTTYSSGGNASQFGAAADATGSGGKGNTIPTTGSSATIGGASLYQFVTLPDILILTAQTVFILANTPGSSNVGVYVSDFTF